VFTGIVDDVGTVESVNVTGAGRELRVRSKYSEVRDGESIALSGVCLTVRETGEGWFSVAAVQTTVGRTTIGGWRAGTRVNLERAMQLGDRLGGHIVQGHVDFVAAVEDVRREGDALLVDLAVAPGHDAPVVLHGSITVDGVSLTVNKLLPAGLQLSIIEYTLRHTTLGELKPGAAVNVEGDVIGKHVARLLAPYTAPGGGESFNLSL